ncbi:MAG TPA: class I SAM-dependent methyltransferase [Thermoleophilaceae bacterium]|nr:class I SAM-dependent methyltransferase [Thermoleophilaceae bacterium]
MTVDQSALFERRYFDEVYDDAYDQRNPSYKHRSYLREVRQAAPAGGLLLDVGCAYGSFLRQAVADYSCVGCDVSGHAVEVASRRLPGVRVFQSHVLALAPDHDYDVVTCFDVLEHVPELDAALAHLRTVLRPRGVLVITVPVYDTPVGRLVGLLDRDPTHVHKLSRRTWLDRMRAAGFEEIRWRGILRYYLGGPAYLHWCSASIRRFSPAILVTGVAAEADR